LDITSLSLKYSEFHLWLAPHRDKQSLAQAE
jgi:hypothetical protein